MLKQCWWIVVSYITRPLFIVGIILNSLRNIRTLRMLEWNSLKVKDVTKPFTVLGNQFMRGSTSIVMAVAITISLLSVAALALLDSYCKRMEIGRYRCV